VERQFLVVIEQTSDGSYSAYLPDVPGCVACGDSREEAKSSIQGALEFHFDGIQSACLPLPTPTTVSDYVGV
jgi:predicted RNase H-like HicB family nuclease